MYDMVINIGLPFERDVSFCVPPTDPAALRPGLSAIVHQLVDSDLWHDDLCDRIRQMM